MRKKKSKRFEKGLTVVIIVCSLISIALSLYSYQIYLDMTEYYSPSFEFEGVDAFNECDNLSLEPTAWCLRKYVSTFYNYSLDNQERELTLEELKDSGGSCVHYSKLYLDMASSLGFEGTYILHPVVRDNNGIEIMSAHQWAVIWDDEIRCELDQLAPIRCGARS